MRGGAESVERVALGAGLSAEAPGENELAMLTSTQHSFFAEAHARNPQDLRNAIRIIDTAGGDGWSLS